jgi:hypothetical protein
MPITHHITANKLTFMDHYRLGRLYRFPICCTIRWCLGNFLNENLQAKKRGIKYNKNAMYVPCEIHKKKGRN